MFDPSVPPPCFTGYQQCYQEYNPVNLSSYPGNMSSYPVNMSSYPGNVPSFSVSVSTYQGDPSPYSSYQTGFCTFPPDYSPYLPNNGCAMRLSQEWSQPIAEPQVHFISQTKQSFVLSSSLRFVLLTSSGTISKMAEYTAHASSIRIVQNATVFFCFRFYILQQIRSDAGTFLI